MDDIVKFFAPVVAYVLPGLAGLYGMSFHMPIIRVWFGTAADKDTTVGGFFFVVLASLAVGLVLNGVRWLALENLLLHRWMPKRPNFNYERRKEEKAEVALADIRAQHYVYYQFYSNMVFGLIGIFVGWQTFTRPTWSSFFTAIVALTLIVWIMLVIAKDCLEKYDEKASGVLGIIEPKKSA